MTDEKPAAQKPGSKRIYIYWGVALSLLLAAGLFSWLVVPVWRTHREVRAFAAARDSRFGGGKAAIGRLGGRNSARERLLVYLRMPGWLASPEHRDAATYLLGCSLVDDDYDVFVVMISPDERKVLVSGGDKATIWDLQSGRLTCVLPTRARYEGTAEVSWSPDSRRVITGSGFILGSYTTEATVWDATTGKAAFRVAPGDGIYFVAFSPDGKLLFTGGGEHNVRKSYDQTAARVFIWDASTGKSVSQLQIKKLSELESLSEAVFSADGSTVGLLTKKGARMFDCRTGKEVTTPGGR